MLRKQSELIKRSPPPQGTLSHYTRTIVKHFFRFSPQKLLQLWSKGAGRHLELAAEPCTIVSISQVALVLKAKTPRFLGSRRAKDARRSVVGVPPQ